MVAKLAGVFCPARNALAVGWNSKNLSRAVGVAAHGPRAAIASINSRRSSVLETGKPLKLWAATSVLAPPGNSNLIAIPRGLAIGSLSGILGTPLKSEKRTVILLLGPCRCVALVISLAWRSGVNSPWKITPLAYTARQ